MVDVLVPVEAISDRRLSNSAFVVLAGLMAGPWDEAGTVHVTQEQLARDLGKSLSSVKRALRNLEECGYIRRGRDYSRACAPPCIRLLFRLPGA